MNLSGPVSSRTRASTKRRTKAVYNDCLETFSEAIEKYKCEMERRQDMYNYNDCLETFSEAIEKNKCEMEKQEDTYIDLLQTFTNAIELYGSEK